MNKIKKIALLTLNYNNSQETDLLIKSALECKEINRIIILDNNSEKESYEELKNVVRKYDTDQIIVERSEKNLGFSGGINCLIRKYKTYDVYILANSDLILDNKAIFYLNKASEKYKDAVLTSAVFIYTDKNKTNKHLSTPVKYSKEYKITFDLIKKDKKEIRTKKTIRCSESGATLMYIPKFVFEKVGLWDSNNFFFFTEDGDFFHRLHENNVPVYYVGNALTWHPAVGASGKENAFLLYHRIRGYIIFFRKYGKYNLLLKYLLVYIPIKLIALLSKPKLIVPAFKAILDGISHKIKENPRI